MLNNFRPTKPSMRKRCPDLDLSMGLNCQVKAPFEPIKSITGKLLAWQCVFFLTMASCSRMWLGPLLMIVFLGIFLRFWLLKPSSMFDDVLSQRRDPEAPEISYFSLIRNAWGKIFRRVLYLTESRKVFSCVQTQKGSCLQVLSRSQKMMLGLFQLP